MSEVAKLDVADVCGDGQVAAVDGAQLQTWEGRHSLCRL